MFILLGSPSRNTILKKVITGKRSANWTSQQKEKEVIGYAAAVNGKVENFDVYGSSALFAKLWPRLLRASAIEAVAALAKDERKFELATAAAVAKMLADADKGKKKEEKVVNGRVHLVTRQSENNVFFETRDREHASQPVHRSGK
jgi:hypothetical protein